MAEQRRTITVSETIHVRRPPEAVFDYTQDYATRTVWDPAVSEAMVLGEDPRRVRVRVRNTGTFTVEYRLFRRPERTSAAFTDADSWFVAGGGGSWSYEPKGDGTDWTQTNTLELRHPRLLGWMAGMIERSLRRSMRDGMAAARAIMEAAPDRSKAD